MKALPPAPKSKAPYEKWATVVLVVLCGLLLTYLARRTGIWAQAPPSKPARTQAAHSGKKPLDAIAQFDPGLNLDLLHRLQSRPEPRFARNPFEYPVPKLPPKPAATAPAAPAPPKPPPPPIKALGYMEEPGGVREATISDESDNIYVVHENETFANRFKVLKISPTVIDIEDTTTQQAIQLPVPQ